jgi:hypothetical protein
VTPTVVALGDDPVDATVDQLARVARLAGDAHHLHALGAGGVDEVPGRNAEAAHVQRDAMVEDDVELRGEEVLDEAHPLGHGADAFGYRKALALHELIACGQHLRRYERDGIKLPAGGVVGQALHVLRHRRRQQRVDAERAVRQLPGPGDPFVEHLRRAGGSSQHPETSGVRDRRREIRSRSPAHAGEKDRVVDVEEVAQRRAKVHSYSFPFDQ